MRKSLIPMVVAMLTLLWGCRNASSTGATSANNTTSAAQSSSSASSSASLSPEELGNLGAQIKKQPNDADKLLAEHGLNEQSFAAAIRKVSENPADAKRYSAAYRSAS